MKRLPGRLSCLMLMLTWLAAAPDPAVGEQAVERARRFGHATPKPRLDNSIRLATYNLENLFDPFDDPTLRGEYDDIRMTTSPQRCRELAAILKTVDADIVALQEVESLKALRWFRDTYLPDAGYKHIVSKDVGYFRGIECSIMSRFPIERTRTWPGVNLDDAPRVGPGWAEVPAEDRRGMTFRRSPLAAWIRVKKPRGGGTYELVVLSLHHKAGRGSHHRREAEALGVVHLLEDIQREEPDCNIAIMGDFNAAPWDKSFRVYLEAGFVDTLAHRVIPRWKNADQEEAALYKTHHSARVIDYILLNAAAYREYVAGSAHVLGTPLPPESYDWRTDPYPPGYASDHYPLIIDLVPIDRK